MKQASIFCALVLGLGFAGCSAVFPTVEGPTEEPINLFFTFDSGQHNLAELRGLPIVLVLIRTSDLASQVHMIEVEQAFGKMDVSVQFLLLTIDANEAAFIEPYAQSLGITFPAGVAEPAVGQGKSVLATIPSVPITYFIDKDGYLVDFATGVIESSVIVDAVQALSRK